MMKRLLLLSLIAMFALAACGGAEDSGNSEDSVEPIPTADENPTPLNPEPTPTIEIVPEAQTQPETTVQEQPAAQTVSYNGPAWTTIELTNAVTGETFTLADFAGKAVFVHPMATWCTNCRASQSNIRNNVIGSVNPDEVAFISLSVETNISASTLASYAADNQFGWTFAVLTPDALAALVQHFGPSISNPPTQPHFIIAPDGTPTDLMTGSDSADEIIDNLNAARGA